MVRNLHQFARTYWQNLYATFPLKWLHSWCSDLGHLGKINVWCHNPVYTKMSHLMANGNNCKFTQAHVCITGFYAIILLYVHITVYCAMTVPYEFFWVFEGSSLEAPRAVLFHATTIHCHDGMDHDGASVSFWDQSYWFAPNSKFQSDTKDRETHEQDELSQRKYSRQRLFSQDIAILVAKV